MKWFKFYEVGGKIRDELLGLTNKDVDYVAVPNKLLLDAYADKTVGELFQELTRYLQEEKFEIFLITPDCFTIRARFPKDYPYQGLVELFYNVEDEEGEWHEENYEKEIYAWCSLIHDIDAYYRRFISWVNIQDEELIQKLN